MVPQLDLEILPSEANTCVLHGLFGPKPAVWTLFMFAHFIIGSLFVAAAIWAYTNFSLDKPYALQITIMGILFIGWFVLYFAGSMGKSAGKAQMHALNKFMQHTLKTYLL